MRNSRLSINKFVSQVNELFDTLGGDHYHQILCKQDKRAQGMLNHICAACYEENRSVRETAEMLLKTCQQCLTVH